jgi:predicted nucleic acid-binding protein
VAFVVDNSVVVAWFVESQANAYTRRMRQRAEREGLTAPQLWPVEFAAVLRGLERREILGPHEVDRVAARVIALGITIDREAPMRELIELSRRFGVSCYDAAYLELAIRRGMPFATRDDGLARAAENSGLLLR